LNAKKRCQTIKREIAAKAIIDLKRYNPELRSAKTSKNHKQHPMNAGVPSYQEESLRIRRNILGVHACDNTIMLEPLSRGGGYVKVINSFEHLKVIT